jgi:cytoplasmic iron level regulating protein YaaA (DUF328/UPF0246 family)
VKYRKPKPRRDPLRRRTIRRKSNFKPLEFIKTEKKEKGSPFSQSKDYKYFWGHIVKEVVKQLPDKRVVCWYNEHMLSLQTCAYNKFLKENNYCKRCTLFQKDEHAQDLKVLITEWEKDELENPEE